MSEGNAVNVSEEDIDRYESNGRDPEAAYVYKILYDENVNVAGELRLILAKNMTGAKDVENYKNMFGTTINFPHFLH